MEIEDYIDFLAQPMFEVFCISIHPEDIKGNNAKSLGDGDPCAIRGIARVLDENGTTYDLYNRNFNNLEVVPFGGFLSITGFRIVPFKVLKFSMMLYDTSRDIEIANDIFDLDYSKVYSYNRVHVQKVKGQHGYASVYHATFHHAITASVGLVELHKRVSASDPDNSLSGTIVARLKRIYGDSSPDANDMFPSTILFNNRLNADESKYAPAQFQTPIKLFRSYVVVPVDCSLVIEADFCDNTGAKIAMGIQFKPIPYGSRKDTVASQNCEMRVEVKWYDACYWYIKRPREIKVMDDDEFEESESEDSCDDEQPSTLSESSADVGSEEDNTMPSSPEDQHHSLSMSRWWPRAPVPSVFAFAEVFSVLICVDDNDLEICGTVKMYDSFDCFVIFNGKERCFGRRTLSILGPPVNPTGDLFGIRIDLKDGKGRVVSQGFVDWMCYKHKKHLCDRYMCTAIQGEIGFAVVHYSMFSYSLHALIRVSFLSHHVPEGSVNVFGRITCQYGNYEYPTPYDQEYYTSTIFSKPRDDCVEVQLALGSTLPLLKNRLSVPIGNSLILDVNLKVIGPLNTDDVYKQTEEHVDELVEFKSRVDGYFLFEKGDCIISMSVEWGCDGVTKDFQHPMFPDKRILNRAMRKASLNACRRTKDTEDR